MITSKGLIKKAIQHFPRWMDIRKRYFSSVGGQLLESIAEETADIQKEVDNYVKQFFIPFYEDKCESIPDFIFKANIGEVNINEVTLTSPELEITTSIKTFYDEDSYAYYQDGFIFVKDNVGEIFYLLDGYISEATLEKMHVWNIYDEFAVFTGLERYEDETNRELFNRIINSSKRVLNSSEQGLKNAIIANLINIVPELNDEDIVLERPTASNLAKYYDEFNLILDKLTEVNKDVLKMKKWDIDKWSNDFKKIDYIPHLWDVDLDEHVNGIGDNDDLKPVIIDAINKTDLDLSFYKKSETQIDSYIKDKNIDHTLNLSLIKYNDTLNPYTAKYSITASEADEIVTTEMSMPITVDLYETLSGEHYRKLDELIEDYSTSLKDVEVIKAGLLENNKYYRLRFTPKSKYEGMEIYSCRVVDEFGYTVNDSDGNLFDFKYPKGDFVLKNEVLINDLVKKTASSLADYNVAENISETGSGVTIDNISMSSKLILETIGCSSEKLKIVYDCEMSKVLDHDIHLNNFFYDDNVNAYVPDKVNSEKSIAINIEANQFSVDVDKGQCIITALINGNIVELEKSIVNGKCQYKTERFNHPQKMTIEIASMLDNYVEISEIKYSNYELNIFTQDDALIKDYSEDDLYWMPQGYENKLIITMKTNTQFAPIIRTVFIGQPLDSNNAYETDLIVGMDDVYLDIESNCNVELYESNNPFAVCDKYDDNQKVHRGYNTDKVFKAMSNDAYIILNTSEYININSIKISEGSYETSGYGTDQKHIIKLSNGQSISGITINGHYDSVIASSSLHDLIKNENISYEPHIQEEEEGFWEKGHKLYANKLMQCFIIENNNLEQEMVKISSDSFRLSSSHKISKAVISNLPYTLQAAFSSMNDSGEYVSIGDEHSGPFSNLYIYPKYAKEYVARNEYTTYAHHREGIEIVNTFNNKYEPGKLMVYKLNNPNTEDYSIKFSNGKDWSVGQDRITIDLNQNKDYNLSQKMITETIKLGSTISLKEIYTSENKEKIEIAQYIIDDKDADYEVIYKSDFNDIAYDKAEFITIKNDGFNKLKYSNIVGIKYLGREIYDEQEDNLETIEESNYELDKEKGIIIWKNKELIDSGEKLYIIYSIKKAIAVKFDLDLLYKKVQYPISAYKKLNTYKLEDIEDGKKINLIKPMIDDIELSNKIAKDYKNSDAVFVTCKQPGFSSEKSGDTIVIKKTAESNSLAIKSGWYYMLGREYYMFATDQSINLIEDEHSTMQEVSRIENELYLHKKTSNYIRNSKMALGSLANSYNLFDFNDVKTLRGSSKLNSITACDSYNHWTTFAMNISLAKGLNGLGLLFESYQKKDIGYALLDITKYISDKTYISFYNPDGLSVYIGKERLVKDISLTDTISISTMAEITSKDTDCIYYSSFKKEEGYKYYIIVRGNGVLDDIVIQDGENPNTDVHVKNISTMNLELVESITNGVVSRVVLNQEKGNKNNGAEINSLGYIVNASNVDWNITKIKSYSTEKDWLSGWSLDNVNVFNINDKDCAVTTEEASGKIVTRPIYIGDPKTIKSVVFKINNIPIKSMSGFNAQLLQAQTSNGNYMTCKHKMSSSSSINYSTDLMYPYIKLSVDIPKNKVIDNIEIYLEYKSTDQCSPTERIESNGQFVSKIFDSHYSSIYRLKSIEIEDQEGSVELFIRASRENAKNSVWTDWHQINIENNNITNNIEFENYRFFQIKVLLKEKDSRIKIKHFDLEVIK